MRNKINKIFTGIGVKSIDSFLPGYIQKKKIIVFVPLEFTDKLTFDMAQAGAGLIGNYELCSFRMKGLGTYKPNAFAKPFKGKNNSISFEEEVRLEMECSEEKLDSIIDAMLESHPYEEVAYEIYNFSKRSNKPAGYLVELQRKIPVSKLISTIQKNLKLSNIDSLKSIKKIAVIEKEIENHIISKARESGCDAVLSINKFSTILKII